jgi:hypothetical protein
MIGYESSQAKFWHVLAAEGEIAAEKTERRECNKFKLLSLKKRK